VSSWDGIVVPPGDPDEVLTAARQLTALYDKTTNLRNRLGAGAGALAGSWAGTAQHAFERVVSRGIRGLSRLANAHLRAAGSLRAYASALREAQAAVRAAQHGLDGAWETWQRAEAHARSAEDAAVGLAADALDQARRDAQAVRDRAWREWKKQEHAFRRQAQEALDHLRTRAAAARRELEQSSGDIRHESMHEFVDVLGAPGLGFEMLGLGMTTNAAANVARTVQALESGDFAELMALDGEAYGPVEAAVAEYGPESIQALDAWFGWQSGSFDRALGELGHAVDGLGEIPSSTLGAAFDIVGKAGLVTGAVGDVMTIADGKSSGMVRGMSGANLAGIGMAGLGTEFGASAAGLVGIDAVAGWVPVAGQVLVGATALYLAGDWAYHHWGGIKSAAGAAVDDVEHVASGAVHIASGAVHTAEDVASHLNPFSW
jgi:uncharacterized protein YukE